MHIDIHANTDLSKQSLLRKKNIKERRGKGEGNRAQKRDCAGRVEAGTSFAPRLTAGVSG